MRLNSRGEAALGVAGTVSIDGHVVYARGFSPAWTFNEALVFAGLERGGHPDDPAAWHLYEHTRGGGTVEIHPLGAHDVKAGGGRWAAWRDGFGVFTAAGLFSRSAGLLAVGPGGELVYTRDRQTGAGLVVHDGQHDIYEVGGVVASDVRSYGGRRVSWRNPDGSIETSFTLPLLMIAGEAVFGAVVVRIAGEEWVVYHEGRVLRARPMRSTVGIAIDSTAPEHYFNHDAIVLADGRLQVSWSHGPGELPSDYRPPVIVDVATAPRVDFAAPDPAPEPEPKPEPEPEEETMKITIPKGTILRGHHSTVGSDGKRYFWAAEHGGGGEVNAERFVGMPRENDVPWPGPGAWENDDFQLTEDLVIDVNPK